MKKSTKFWIGILIILLFYIFFYHISIFVIFIIPIYLAICFFDLFKSNLEKRNPSLLNIFEILRILITKINKIINNE